MRGEARSGRGQLALEPMCQKVTASVPLLHMPCAAGLPYALVLPADPMPSPGSPPAPLLAELPWSRAPPAPSP